MRGEGKEERSVKSMVDSIEGNLDDAIKLLKQMYNFGKNYHHVENPVVYALHNTWKEFEKRTSEEAMKNAQQSLF